MLRALLALVLSAPLCAQTMTPDFSALTLDFATPPMPALQRALATADADLRARFGMAEAETAVGVLDLRRGRLALLRPDAIFYAASVPKIAILLAWFQTHPAAATTLDPDTRHELGLMIKVSDNEMASKYSRSLGLATIREVLDRYRLYDAAHGGGLWMGKHYGQGGERIVDPVGGHSHAATVRQLLRFYLLLEQDRLVSAAASRTMRAVFASPDIPHRDDKFVHGLAGRGLELRRKAGWWENWFHDTAVVTGPGRHYILVALTHHARGDDYLAALAARVDDLLATELPKSPE
jgi:beta-lactamase class A